MYVQRDIAVLSRNHFCCGKAIIITYTEYVYVCRLSYLACKAHAPITLSSVACLALQNYSTLSHKRHKFQKNFTQPEICVLIFSTAFICNFFLFSE